MKTMVAAVILYAFTPVAFAADWQMSGQDLTNDRYQPRETRIGPENVATLKPAWTFKTLGPVSATPMVADGDVYFPDWGGGLYKIDARTGKLLWSRKISQYTGTPDAVSRTTPVLADGVLVVAEQPAGFGAAHDNSFLLGVDSQTGDLRWKATLNSHPATIFTQSPVVYRGVVYIGTSSNEEHLAENPTYPCCSFQGNMNAVDVRTGKVIWQTTMVPQGYSGAAIWSSTPAIDPARGVVYVTTGNNYATPEAVATCQSSGRRDCLPADDHIDSFVALDLKTGAIKWATRAVPFDTWNGNCFLNEPGLGTCPEPRGGDLDFGQGALLFRAEVGGEPRDLLGAGQKSGMFWARDRQDRLGNPGRSGRSKRRFRVGLRNRWRADLCRHHQLRLSGLADGTVGHHRDRRHVERA